MKITTLNFTLQALNNLYLPEYKGSTFRGAFGHALKNTVCVVSHGECGRCLLREKCAYPYLFETFNEHDQQVVHPFVMLPPLTPKALFLHGEELKMSVTLFGKGIEYAAYIIYAFIKLGRRGVGMGKGKFDVTDVHIINNNQKTVVYSAKSGTVNTKCPLIDLSKIEYKHIERVTLHFITTTAIKEKGRINFNPDLPAIIKSIKRRLKALSFFHNGNMDWQYPEFTGEIVKTASMLQKNYWIRYSSRQNKRIGFDGFTGKITFEGDLTPYSRFLEAGKYIHIGRGTVYGMGKYELELE